MAHTKIDLFVIIFKLFHKIIIKIKILKYNNLVFGMSTSKIYEILHYSTQIWYPFLLPMNAVNFFIEINMILLMLLIMTIINWFLFMSYENFKISGNLLSYTLQNVSKIDLIIQFNILELTMICRIVQLLSINKLYLPELFYAKNLGLLWPNRFYAYLKLSIMRKFVLNAHPHIFNSLLPQILLFRFFQKECFVSIVFCVCEYKKLEIENVLCIQQTNMQAI